MAPTRRANAFAAALLDGGDVTVAARSGLARHLSAMRRPPGHPAGTPPRLMFIARDELQAALHRYGAEVTRIAYYKLHVDGDDHWLSLYLTADGRIADVSGI